MRSSAARRSFRSIQFIVIACFAGGLPVSSNAIADPKMRLSEEMFDFGFLPEGPHVYHRYWLCNDGTDTLKVTDVQPGCGCTTVPLPKKAVPPGDSVPLDLAFNTRHQNGKVQKSVLVASNDKTMPEKRLLFVSVVGAAEGLVRIAPRAAYLDTLGKESQSFVITNTSSMPYKISVTSLPPEFMSLALSSMELPAGGNISGTLTAGAKTPIGVYTGSFTLRFEGQQAHSVTVPIYGMGFYH